MRKPHIQRRDGKWALRSHCKILYRLWVPAVLWCARMNRSV